MHFLLLLEARQQLNPLFSPDALPLIRHLAPHPYSSHTYSYHRQHKHHTIMLSWLGTSPPINVGIVGGARRAETPKRRLPSNTA
ncbi:hypothetical protein DMENIID0001_121000 [Sergentomyia squamirostris]